MFRTGERLAVRNDKRGPTVRGRRYRRSTLSVPRRCGGDKCWLVIGKVPRMKARRCISCGSVLLASPQVTTFSALITVHRRRNNLPRLDRSCADSDQDSTVSQYFDFSSFFFFSSVGFLETQCSPLVPGVSRCHRCRLLQA